MEKSSSSKNSRDFIRMARLGTAVGFGLMTASLWSLEGHESGMSFKFTLSTVPAFLVGVVVAYLYWGFARRTIESSARPAGDAVGSRSKLELRRFIVISVLLFVGAVFAFFYPLRYVPSEKYADVAFGVILAFVCVGGVLRVVWWLAKLLNEDDEHHGMGEK